MGPRGPVIPFDDYAANFFDTAAANVADNPLWRTTGNVGEGCTLVTDATSYKYSRTDIYSSVETMWSSWIVATNAIDVVNAS